MHDYSEVWRLSATVLRQAYCDGSLTPCVVAQNCLARLDAVNPRINAVVARRDDAMLREAEASTQRYAQGRPLSVLDGIPVSIKDNLQTKDQPTTWGSPALRGHQPACDELPVARLRESGALFIGKTNLPEFALEGYTDNPLFGVTRNPWDLSLTPGGSSGGAVAGVAAGITPLALGTDGGGSIRRPASHCGLVGFKPSIGSIARGDDLPSLLLDFEVVGPLTRTVGDAKMMFDVLRGPLPTDRRSYAAAGARHNVACEALRILYVPTFDDAPVDHEVAASCSRAAEAFRRLGHIVSVGEMPLDIGFVAQAWPFIGQVGLARLFSQRPDWRVGASPKYLEIAAQGEAHGAARLWSVQEQVQALRRDCAKVFQEYDVLITPAAAALPWAAQDAFPSVIAGCPVGPRGHAVFTGWINAAGLPAMALPTEPSASGLPIGIQLVGAYGADDLLFELGAAYEEIAPWANRWPSI